MKIFCFSCFCCIIAIVCSLPLEDEVGYFWHVTDFHMDVNYTTEVSKSDKDYFLGPYKYEICWNNRDKSNGRFGDYNCDASERLVDSAINFIKIHSLSLNGKVKFMIWTGDDTAHADNEYFDQFKMIDIVWSITQKLVKTSIPMFPVLGNHDAFPHNQFQDDPKDLLYLTSGEMWKDANGWTQSAFEEYMTNGGFYKMEFGPFLLVGLNTNLWYKSNHVDFGDNAADPLGQFEWLENTLEEAMMNFFDYKRVLLFAHIPPGKFERFNQYFNETNEFGYSWFKPEYNERFLSILVKYAKIIHLQLYAHHHTDTFKLIKNEAKETVGVQLLAPAVTPWNSTLAPETGGNNPSLRLFKYNTRTGEILDYDQFWLDLNEANSNGFAEWKLEYSFKDFYGAKDFSPQEFQIILDKMKVEDDFFKQYFAANSVQKVDYECDEVCKAYHICTIAEQDYSEFENCIKNEGPTTTENPDSTTMPNSSSRIVFDFFAVLFLISLSV